MCARCIGDTKQARAPQLTLPSADPRRPSLTPPLPAPPRSLIEDGDPAPLHDEAVIAIAAAHGVSPAQALIRWQVQRGFVVIPKSVTPARIASNFDVFGFSLTDAEMATLAGLNKGLRLIKVRASTLREWGQHR